MMMAVLAIAGGIVVAALVLAVGDGIYQAWRDRDR